MTKISKQKLNKVLLFGGSGFLGPNILKKYPNVICVGRSKPPFYIKNKFIKLSDLKQISKLDKIKFDRVIFLIDSDINLNSSNLNLALSHNFIL